MHYDMALKCKVAAAKYAADNGLQIAGDNVDFKPPNHGETYLKFSYVEADSRSVSLSRECRVYLGMVQIDVIFKPGIGTDSARLIAQDVAKSFPEGKILDNDKLNLYVSEWAQIHGVQKHETGWFFPVRFTVRCETKEQSGYALT
ncbi:minor tail protein [Klebsiella phage Solomon]|uniref:Minor tail protein n=1 Tax=Klebsiella phage Solomon TaxID=2767583 RepID=A0A873WDK0_9CAUD|nr:minor tail protein [Klebsiella phage Solomon]